VELYLLRHGIAEPGRPGLSDSDRALTSEGKKKLKEFLRAVAGMRVRPELILSSPLVRAKQTAAIAVEELNYRESVAITPALEPETAPAVAWEEVRLHKDVKELMLVGHEPLFSQLFAHLLGAPSLTVDFKKGALARIDLEAFGPRPKGVLRWLLPPRLAHE